ncbi:MAG TPA: phosphate ABC transporter substrate-binding protein [Epulopiscium sp.]|nr:phosphate ABC transporter substrate-binding protein [Candidatus Epulonipiscium sp.]
MNKTLRIGLTLLLGATLLVGCADKESTGIKEDSTISVISREDGSGTRGAFTELIKIEEKDANGNKVDHTTKEATIAPKTDVMLANVSGDELAIGYISLGSVNESIKAMKIDGVEPTSKNVKNGTYKIARPFNIAIKGDATGLTKDFIIYILSAEGQEVVAESYIPITDGAPKYSGDAPAGKIVVAGSSSVTPIMEKLKEAYELINPNAEIEIQLSDSTSGMNAAIDGICDIGMASRSLKDSEKEALNGIEIAIDGIAVIANKTNSRDDLTTENVKDIFTGAVTKWSEIR